MLKPKYEKMNENDDYDFWHEELNLICPYSSSIDQTLIDVLRCINEKKWYSDTAKELNLSEDYIELIYTIFCQIRWCEYGTSPRGCWIRYDLKYEDLDKKLKEHFYNQWEKKL